MRYADQDNSKMRSVGQEACVKHGRCCSPIESKSDKGESRPLNRP